MSFASVYPLYIHKAEKKGRTKEEVDTIIFWLTGYDKETLQQQIDNKTNFESFFAGYHWFLCRFSNTVTIIGSWCTGSIHYPGHYTAQ